MRIKVVVLGSAVLLLDLVSKWWVATTGWLWHHVVIDGFFKIHYVRNEGIAFGVFHNLESQWKPIILSIMSVVAIIIVLYYIWQTPPHHRLLSVSLGLLLGGILGNFTDRLVNGHVTDFIEVHWHTKFTWPTFNVADAAITCGVLLILCDTFFEELVSSPGEKETTENTGSDIR